MTLIEVHYGASTSRVLIQKGVYFDGEDVTALERKCKQVGDK